MIELRNKIFQREKKNVQVALAHSAFANLEDLSKQVQRQQFKFIEAVRELF